MRLSNINNRTIHLISWGCYLILLTISFSSMSRLNMALYRVIQIFSLHVILFYLNTLVLVPRLMERRKYGLYFLSIVVLIIISLGILYIINIHVFPFGDKIAGGRGLPQTIRPNLRGVPGGKGQDSSAFFVRSIMRNFSSIVAILLLSIVYKMLSQKISKEKQEIAIHNEQLLSEMKFLKSQVNPHFLFNALNNVYTLVHLKDDRAPSMLMKLSEMLRYMLYECNDEWGLLGKEILYIDNYIEMQQLKTKQPQSIVNNFDGADKATLIPPLLLIPFIENSFKHSRIENTKTGWVTMHLISSDEQINFKIANSIPLTPIAKDELGGIGLKNVRRRLELLYPDKYELKITRTQLEFSVILNICNK